jgi:hypothetical protein
LSQEPQEAYKRNLPAAVNKATFVSIAICRGGGIGRRARLRIAKLSVSQRRFPFQFKIVSRWQIGDFSRPTARLRLSSERLFNLAQFLAHRPVKAIAHQLLTEETR